MALLLSGACLTAATPTSQPTPDKAAIQKLVRQLGSPKAEEREKAALELRTLGTAAIPALEQAKDSASFEARIKIKELLDTYHTRGALVLSTIGYSTAYFLEIEAGDVITAVNGVPIESYEDFIEKAIPMENSPRTLTVRTGPRISMKNVREKSELPAERTVDIGPGKIGVYLGDYNGGYGEHISSAMQRLYRCQWEPLWSAAGEDFEHAFEAGLTFDDDSLIEPMYAAACYYAGDKDTAYRHFDAFVDRNVDDKGWWVLMNGLSSVISCKGHLYLHFARQQVLIDPDQPGAALNIAYTHSWSQSRYQDAVLSALPPLRGDDGQVAPFGVGVGLNAIQNALNAMDLVPEAAQAAGMLADVEGASNLFGDAFSAAECAGEYQLAMKLGEAGIRREGRRTRLQPAMADRVVRYCLREGRLDDARRVLDAYDEPDTMDSLLEDLSACDVRWSESQALLAEFARRCLDEQQADREMLEDAFQILSRQTKPDTDELERIVAARLEDPSHSTSGGDSTNYRLYLGAMLALIKEDYTRAEEYVTEAGRTKQLPESLNRAVAFLREAGPQLTDEHALWKRTYRAFDRPAGGCYLLTRDQHIGWTDGREFRSIPLPEDVWSFDEPNHAFVISESGKTVLTAGLGRVYKLRTDESGWEPLCGLPPRTSGFSVSGFEPILDELVEIIQQKDEPITLMWPSARSDVRLGSRMESFMFSDGTWVVHRPKQEGLLKPKRELEETFNKRVEVYDIRTWSDTGYRLWLFTSEGLITWKPGREAMTQVKLPKAEGFLPVMVSRVETPVAKKVRFALFPGQGGTTYLLDTSSGEVTLEGLVEEGYPETYWRQRTVASKREELMNAIAAKNLVWPPQVAATTQAAE